jgi:hypothetical protein
MYTKPWIGGQLEPHGRHGSSRSLSRSFNFTLRSLRCTLTSLSLLGHDTRPLLQSVKIHERNSRERRRLHHDLDRQGTILQRVRSHQSSTSKQSTNEEPTEEQTSRSHEAHHPTRTPTDPLCATSSATISTSQKPSTHTPRSWL